MIYAVLSNFQIFVIYPFFPAKSASPGLTGLTKILFSTYDLRHHGNWTKLGGRWLFKIVQNLFFKNLCRGPTLKSYSTINFLAAAYWPILYHPAFVWTFSQISTTTPILHHPTILLHHAPPRRSALTNPSPHYNSSPPPCPIRSPLTNPSPPYILTLTSMS